MGTIAGRPLPRTARLAALPLRIAGRAASGMARRAVGMSRDAVDASLQHHTAEQLFRTLGQLKAGAMKVGQMMSVFEVLLPEKIGGIYRQSLTKLQESSTPVPPETVHAVLRAELGPRWRSRFREFDDVPVAAASLGQVHRAVWRDRREVAVKIQYPGIHEALATDLDHLTRLSSLFRLVHPTFEIKPVVAELRRRLVEELDYELEAQAQRTFAAAYADDEEIAVPNVVWASGHLLVSEWMAGEQLSAVIAGGTQEKRDRAGRLLTTLHLSGPARAGLLHADPHPGNFRLLPDGRLGVLDFGATARLPDGLPADLGHLMRATEDRDAPALQGALCRLGFLKADANVTPEAVLGYVAPALLPILADGFRFDRSWLRRQAIRMTTVTRTEHRVSKQLQIPPAYLLLHRVTLGTIAMLCQLEARADYGLAISRWLPGYVTAAGSVSGSGRGTPQ